MAVAILWTYTNSNTTARKLFILFDIDNSIANISLYGLRRPKLKFGGYHLWILPFNWCKSIWHSKFPAFCYCSKRGKFWLQYLDFCTFWESDFFFEITFRCEMIFLGKIFKSESEKFFEWKWFFLDNKFFWEEIFFLE